MLTLHYPSYGKLEIVEQPRPAPAADEVVVAVAACGLCGSELETFRSRSPRRLPPLVMGHEFCGVVETVGSGVDEAMVGQRYVVNAIVPCGACPMCAGGDTHLCSNRQVFGMHRPGAFAEAVAVPQRALVPWPNGVSASAACLAEPLANGVHVVRLTADLAATKVVVIGAGPIGLSVLQCFVAMRSAQVVVSDIRDGRLTVARALGANHTVNATDGDLRSEIKRWTDGHGADVVVDAVGSAETKRLSLECARPGGACVWIGLHEDDVTLSTYGITLRELRLFGTYGATLDDVTDAVELIRSAKVDMTSWVSRFALGDGVDAFRRMLDPSGDDIKAVIQPHSDND